MRDRAQLSAAAVAKIVDEVWSYHAHMPGFEGLPTWGTMLCLVEQGLEKGGVPYERQPRE